MADTVNGRAVNEITIWNDEADGVPRAQVTVCGRDGISVILYMGLGSPEFAEALRSMQFLHSEWELKAYA